MFVNKSVTHCEQRMTEIVQLGTTGELARHEPATRLRAGIRVNYVRHSILANGGRENYNLGQNNEEQLTPFPPKQ